MAFLYETHLHTSQASACGLAGGAEQAYAYAKRGYTGIIVTDHFFEGNTSVPFHLPWVTRINMFIAGYKDAKAAGDECGLDVFLGWEYCAGGKEFLTYGLGADFLYGHPELDHMSIRDYSALVRANGGYIAQAHPFRRRAYISDAGAADAALLDGVEAFNAGNGDRESNEEAARFAKEHNLPVQAGTDTHWLNHSFYSGIILKERAKGISDIIAAIRNRDVELITPRE